MSALTGLSGLTGLSAIFSAVSAFALLTEAGFDLLAEDGHYLEIE